MFGPWRFQKPWPRSQIRIGCLNCSTAAQFAFMERRLAVGFGEVYVKRDRKIIYSETEYRRKLSNPNFEDYPSVGDVEKRALQDPDHDWRIEFHGPMHGETYQRQGVGLWVCIESNQGFA